MVDENVPVQVRLGIVKETSVSDMTCQIEIKGRPTRYQVRLRSVITSDTGFICIPAVGSRVLVALIENDAQSSFIVATSDLEALQVKIGNSFANITADGFIVERGGESLKKLLNDLLKAIQQLTVTTPAGPSGVPVNLSAFVDLQTRLSNILKE